MIDLLSGVTIPVVTPLDDSGRADGDAARPYFAALAAAGVRRILLLGSNGEGPLVPTDELRPFVQTAVETWHEYVGDDAVVTVNATAAGTREALRRADMARAAGADAIVLSPPFYFAHGDEDVVSHFAAFWQCGPLIAYNQPKYAAPISLEAAARIFAMEHVVGMKDSSGDPDVLRSLIDLARRNGVGIATGVETALVDGLDAGAVGTVPGVGNLAPRAAVTLFESWKAGDREKAVAVQETLAALTGIHRIHPGVASVKRALSVRGLVSARTEPPLAACDEAEGKRIEELLAPFAGHLIGAETV